MKIVHVISSCSTGGAEIFVKSLTKKITQQDPGISIELWVMSRISSVDNLNTRKLEFESEFIREIEDNGMKIRFIDKRPRRDWLKSALKIQRLFEASKPDIVHTHSEEITFHVSRALLFKRPILVQTIHNTVVTHKSLIKFFTNYFVSNYIAISEKVKDILIKDLGICKSKVTRIYNGIDLDKFYFINRKTSEKVTDILSVGRLTKQKDYVTYLKAISTVNFLLNEKNIELPMFNIVGDGELKNNLEEMKRQLNLENVQFLGVRRDVPDLLRKSDIYIMSSEWEGLSISLLEALASGIPIIATNAGSNTEIIEDNINGVIVPIKSPNELAEKIVEIIENFELRNSFISNREDAIKKFDIDVSSKAHVELYYSIAGKYQSYKMV